MLTKKPRNFYAPMGWVACIFYFLAMASLFPGPLVNATVPAMPRDIALVICCCGLLSALAWYLCVRRTKAVTVRTYFSRTRTAMIIWAVSMLVWYVDTIIGRSGLLDRAQVEKLVALNCVLVIAIVVAFVRGFMAMRSKWKTGEDVFDFVRKAEFVAITEARAHDYAFYGGVVISMQVIGQTFKAQDLILHICGGALAVIIPFICGSQIAESLLVRRIFPNDAPLPVELQI